MPEPDAPPVSTAGQKEFPCRQCGAKMTFDPAAQAVACPYCGHEHMAARQQQQMLRHDSQHTRTGRGAVVATTRALTLAVVVVCVPGVFLGAQAKNVNLAVVSLTSLTDGVCDLLRPESVVDCELQGNATGADANLSIRVLTLQGDVLGARLVPLSAERLASGVRRQRPFSMIGCSWRTKSHWSLSSLMAPPDRSMSSCPSRARMSR